MGRKSSSQLNKGSALTTEDIFTHHDENKGNLVLLGSKFNNNIIFVLSGEIEVQTKGSTSMLFKVGYMYNLSKLNSPYQGKMLKKTRYITFRTNTLVPHVSAIKLQNIINSCDVVSKEIESLPFGEVIYFYLRDIICLKKNKVTSPNVYDIKGLEFLYYIREFYTKEELAHFFHASLSTYTNFKMSVYINYNNHTSVNELSQKCYMTTKTFTRHFKTEFGITPHKWLIEEKINNLNDLIFNKRTSFEVILEEFKFRSIAEFRQFCARHNLYNILEFFKQLKEIS